MRRPEERCRVGDSGFGALVVVRPIAHYVCLGGTGFWATTNKSIMVIWLIPIFSTILPTCHTSPSSSHMLPVRPQKLQQRTLAAAAHGYKEWQWPVQQRTLCLNHKRTEVCGPEKW